MDKAAFQTLLKGIPQFRELGNEYLKTRSQYYTLQDQLLEELARELVAQHDNTPNISQKQDEEMANLIRYQVL